MLNSQRTVGGSKRPKLNDALAVVVEQKLNDALALIVGQKLNDAFAENR
jgi:hypothetical protein